MDPWMIFYEDWTYVWGLTEAEWQHARSTGVQAVIWMKPPHRDNRRWTGVEDRHIWTGDDEYDPFGWGVKYGSYVSDEDYAKMMEEVFYARH